MTLTDGDLGAGQCPGWFHEAMAATPTRGIAQVDGVPIAYRHWGTGPATPVLLIHGSGANSSWWDHIAPHLAGDRPVIALDLSGHGDSGRRSTYDYPYWATEVCRVAKHVCPDQRAILIGHSFGGAVALAARQLFPQAFESVVTVDSPMRVMSPVDWQGKVDRAARVPRTYPNRLAAIRAFRTVPEQPVPEYLHRHVAGESIRAVDTGWTWKFDPLVFARPQFDPSTLRPGGTPVTLIRSELGSMTRVSSTAMAVRLGEIARELTILEARHHVMFDQPVALTAALRTLLLL